MQLDAEENGQPFYKPAVVAAPRAAPAPIAESSQTSAGNGTGQESAATTTVEQEE